MGNEQGRLQPADPSRRPPPDFSGFKKILQLKINEPPDHSKEKSNERLQAKGDIAIGDTFVTWLSSAMTEVSYKEGRVVDIFEMEAGTPLYGDSRRKQPKKKYVVIQYDNGRQAELDIVGLKASVARAQQALLAEQEWLERVNATGLRKDATVELWVPDPITERRLDRLSVDSPSFDSYAGRSDSDNADQQVGGSIHNFRVLDIKIGWHFQDAVVQLKCAPVLPDGTLGDADIQPFHVVNDMLENAKAAKAVFQKELEQIAEHEGIRPGAKVDLWIEELDTNVRGEIVNIGCKFYSLNQVELQPVVSYFVDRRRNEKAFPDYVSFVTSWKLAKYVAEQQYMLTQEAFEKGVKEGAQICVYQEPMSSRWQLKEGGALDAEVQEMKFDFNASKKLVSMRVILHYHHISGSDPNIKRRLSLKESALATEIVAWDDLMPRLRCKVVVSSISCQDLIDRGKADP